MLHVWCMRDRAKCMHRSCIIAHRACTIHARWRERCMNGAFKMQAPSVYRRVAKSAPFMHRTQISCTIMHYRACAIDYRACTILTMHNSKHCICNVRVLT